MLEVSVIIPTYNRKVFLREAINSVFNQDYKEFELIIIDDGSTDRTQEMLKEFTGKILYKYQENKGPSAARNLGITLSKGKFISFLDSDDLWDKKKLSEQTKFFREHPNAKICYTDEIWIKNGVRINPMKKHRKYSGWIFEKCLPLCIISASSVMIKKELFDEVGFFDESLPACEDYDMWLRLSAKFPIHFINKKLITKRGGHSDQLSKKFMGIDRFRIKALEKILSSKVLSEDKFRLALLELQKKCSIYANGCLKRGKTEEGNYYLTLPNKYK